MGNRAGAELPYAPESPNISRISALVHTQTGTGNFPLLQQHQLARLRKIVCLQPVDIHSAGQA